MTPSLADVTFIIEANFSLAFYNFKKNFQLMQQSVTQQSISQHVRRLVARFRNTGGVCKGNSPGRKSLLTEDVLDDVRDRFSASQKKSLRQLSSQPDTNLILNV